MADPTGDYGSDVSDLVNDGGVTSTPDPAPTTTAADTAAGTAELARLGIAPSAQAPQAPTDPSKVSASGSFQGITDRGIAMSQKARGPVDQRIASRVAAADAAEAPGLADYNQAIAGQAQADRAEGNANAAHFQRQLEINRTEQQMYSDFAAAEKVRQAHVAADNQHYLGEYEQQLAIVRNLTAQSGNPLATLSRTQAAGLSLAQFAQGFLAPAGVHIDVTGQIDRWVERSMQEHQQQIANARSNANDTLTLYGLARQASQDDWEATQRYRGFVIEGLKAGVQAEASRWGSQAAIAAAQDKIAQLNVQSAATKIQLGQHREQLINDITGQEYAKAHNQAMEGIEGMKAQAELERAKAANKPKAMIPISNPYAVKRDANGKVISGPRVDYMLDPNAPEPVMKDAIERVGKAREWSSNFNGGIEKIRQLKSNMDKIYGPQWYKDRDSEAYRRFNNQRNLIVADIQHMMTGAQANETEIKNYTSLIKDDRWLEHGNHAAELDDLAGWGHQRYESAMNTPGVLPVTEPEDQRVYMPASPNDPESDLQAARNNGEGPATTPMQAAYDGALSTDNDATAGKDKMSGAWKVYTGGKESTEPGWAAHLDTMATKAANAMVNGQQDQDAQEAISGLVRVMTHGGVPEDRRRYAAALLESVQHHPDKLAEDLGATVTDGDEYTGALYRGNTGYSAAPMTPQAAPSDAGVPNN